MSKKMLIDAANPEEVRVCVLDKNRVEDFDFESSARKPLRGNIYLARVTRVEPSLQAAFIEYGGNRHGFLAFSEIHPDYYQIPVSDRQAIQEAEALEASLAAQLNLAARDDDDDLDSDSHDDHDLLEDKTVDDETSEPTLKAETDDQPDSELSVASEDKAATSETDSPLDDDENAPHAEEEEEEEEDGEEEAEDRLIDEKSADENIDLDKEEIEIEPSTEVAPTETDDADETDAEDNGIASAKDLADEDDDAEDDNDDELDATSHAALLEKFKEARRNRMKLVRSYKIQEVIKRRQIILVQVVKEERGNKGAALTTYMSLAGRYCVLMPNTARGGGISRKIPNAGDRKKLRRVVNSLSVPDGMGLIIRTAGAKRTKAEIKRDYDYLSRLWENIRALTLKSVAPSIIYEEASLIKRAIRDLYDKDIDKVSVEGEAGYREAKDFMKMLMPSHAKNVQRYKETVPLFLKHGVENQLDAMYQPNVRLKSGGYIVINQTEALIAVDVNSGKATRERNIERTALATNIEAAVETARQCRLRDLAGLIVIDFIDMEEHKNNRTVEKKFKEALKSDRARIQVGRISSFGLLEMSRQRRRSGIVDGTTQACPTCSGAGAVRSVEMAALRILRAAEADAVNTRESIMRINTATDVALYILNHKRDWLNRLEEAYGISIEILGDIKKAGDQYDIEKSGPAREVRKKTTHISADLGSSEADDDQPSPDADASSELPADDEEQKPKKRRRRRRRKKSDQEENASANDDAAASASEDKEDATTASDDKADREEDDEDKPKRRRRRGRRGGRRNNRRRDGEEGSETEASQSDDADNADDKGNNETPDRTPAAASMSVSMKLPEPEKVDASSQRDNESKSATSSAPEAAAEKEGGSEPQAKAEESGEKVKRKTRKGWWQRALGS